MQIVERLMYGMKMPRLGTDDANALPFPLPPLPEQKRIVAKVDELMTLCDQLEVEQAKQRTLKSQAVVSTLHHLTQPDSPTALAEALNILTRKFGDWFNDPITIKYLRTTILQLAVQGKLVEQNPNDEPANKLIARINPEKYHPKLKEMPFELPPGWMWASFPQLGKFGRGKSKHRPRNAPHLYIGGKYPFVQTGDVSRANGFIRSYSAKYSDEGLAQSKMWSAGTMCITIAANIAETAILTFDACFPDSIVGFIPHKEIGDSKYFEYFMRTAKTRIQEYAPSTAQKNINLGILEQVAIPLPPFAEKKRIVAKVDELMDLCDQLEAQITQTQTLNAALTDSLVHHLATTKISTAAA
jgi:type I restriction enzyme, S subunit